MANETVLFKRGDSATITSTPVTDGQILFDTSGNGKMYLDNGTDRLEMGGAITVDASLSKTSTNAIQNKAVTGNILNSLAEVSAATQQNTIAGALALKEVNSSLNNKFITVSYNVPFTVEARPSTDISSYVNITKDITVDGYTPIGVIGIKNPVGNVTWVSSWFIERNSFGGTIQSCYASTLTQNILITVLYKANAFS